MYKSTIIPPAKEDIKETTLWYNKKKTGLGKMFITQIREKIQLIERNPKAYNIRYANVRTAVLNVFPFMIHYITDEENKTVIILAVLHTSRNPDIWGKR